MMAINVERSAICDCHADAAIVYQIIRWIQYVRAGQASYFKKLIRFFPHSEMFRQRHAEQCRIASSYNLFGRGTWNVVPLPWRLLHDPNLGARFA